MTWRVAGAARATIGARAKQEDAFAIRPAGVQTDSGDAEGMLAAVADGMGGHAGGEIAGQLACGTFVAAFAEAEGGAGDRLRGALEAANAAIAARVREDRRLSGMGCTLVGAWIDADGLRWASVGDSLLLLIRAPDVLRLNADHSLGAFLDEEARRDRISAAEARKNPHRNALRSALTGKPVPLLDLRSEPYALADGDWLLLASDGIATLSGDEIGDIVLAGRDAEPARIADRLIAAVLAKNDPAQDNTTVLVLKVAGDARAAADEAPTRVLRPEPALPVLGLADASALDRMQGRAGTLRAGLFLRHRSAAIGLCMAAMFAVGWLLRAWLG